MARKKRKQLEEPQIVEEVVIIEESPVQQIKSIFTSKTFWVNILALIAFAVQNKWGFIMDESLQAQILMVINIILRAVTKEPVKWTSSKK